MKTEEFRKHLAGTFEKCLGISAAKNADYAGETDPFKNFRVVEQFGIASVEQGLLTRLCDKFSRISTLIGSGKVAQVKDESVDDTILDAINYLAILRAYRESQKSKVTYREPTLPSDGFK